MAAVNVPGERFLLPPYTAELAVCPKCGYDQEAHGVFGLQGPAVSTAFCRKMEAPPPEHTVTVVGPDGVAHTQPVQRPPEHPVIAQIAPGQEALVRVCRRCDYPWAEACIDDPDLALARLEQQ